MVVLRAGARQGCRAERLVKKQVGRTPLQALVSPLGHLAPGPRLTPWKCSDFAPHPQSRSCIAASSHPSVGGLSPVVRSLWRCVTTFLSVPQEVDPSSCGSSSWSCSPTSRASPSSAGLGTDGSSSSLTPMRYGPRPGEPGLQSLVYHLGFRGTFS